jgi:uncharacterized membrane protein
MPYCVQCGNQVGGRDQFCGRCGTAQKPAPMGSPSAGGRDFFSNVSARNAAMFSYLPFVGWIVAIIVLASDRFRRDDRVRFHAFQGLYLFVAWVLVDWLITPALFGPAFGFRFPFFRTIETLMKLVIFGSWIFMMIRVNHDQDYHLPIIGELAERSVSEQRL